MRVACVADVHLGNHKRFGGPVQASMNDRCRRAVAVFDTALQRAKDSGADLLVVAGDLLDYDVPEPSLLRAVQQSIEAATSDGMEVVLLLGNHDQTSAAVNDHALSPLRPVALVVDTPMLLRRKHWKAELVLVPFRTGPAKDWLPGVLDEMLAVRGGGDAAPPSRFPRLLALHLGIRDGRTAPWLKTAADAIDVALLQDLCARHGITHVVAGNWHDRREWVEQAHVLQLGALVPTGWDNPGLSGYGTLATWDGSKLTYEELPGPRFVAAKTTAELDEAVAAARASGHQLYLTSTALPEELADAARALGAHQLAGHIVAGEVLPDQQVATAQMKSAATAARRAETLDEAVDAFVRKMPLPEGVQRDAVADRVRGYLK